MENIRIKSEEYVEEQGVVLDPDEGPFDATLTGFAEFNGEYGPGLVWRFKVYTEDGDEVEAAGFSSLSMADGDRPSKLITWTRAILGDIPAEGVDLSDLEGKPVRVDIKNYTKNGITKNKVMDVKAPRKNKSKRNMTEVA